MSFLDSTDSPSWRLSRETNVRVGVCSWADATLVDSGFYPAGVRTPEKRLRYYTEQFPIVEVDASYYAIPDPANARNWVERSPQGFKFNVKAFSLFTGHPTRPQGVPADLRPFVDPNASGDWFYLDTIDPGLVTEIWGRFAYAIEPLIEAGKLGVILCQFPPWYKSSPEFRDRIERCVEGVHEALPGVTAAVEFRSRSWMESSSRQRRIFNWLHGIDASYVAVDEPQGTRSSVPPVIDPEAAIAVVRFHGRRVDTWEESGIDVTERFRWDYRDEELKWWVPQVEQLSRATREVHVMMNNCHGDSSIRAARDFTRLYADLVG